MASSLVTIVAALLCLPPVGAKPGAPAEGGGKPAPKNEAAQALRQRIENARFDGMGFEEFTEWLARTSKVNVVVRWGTVEAAGVTPSTPFSLKLRGVKLSKVLAEALKALSPEDNPLDYQVVGNIITISTRADLRREMITQTYDVADLVFVAENFKGIELNLEDIGRGRPGSRTGGMVNQSGGGAGEPEESYSEDEQVDALIKTIMAAIEPESWRRHGGRGTIAHFQGRLVIRNHADVHLRIKELLAAQRQ